MGYAHMPLKLDAYLCVDLDKTVALHGTREQRFTNAKLNKQLCLRLAGRLAYVSTARGFDRFAGDMDNLANLQIIEQELIDWLNMLSYADSELFTDCFSYLIFGMKPIGQLYVDDKASKLADWCT